MDTRTWRKNDGVLLYLYHAPQLRARTHNNIFTASDETLDTSQSLEICAIETSNHKLQSFFVGAGEHPI
jgi:hypothetical protein